MKPAPASHLTDDLSAFAARLQFSDLPAVTVDITKALVLDCIGTSLAASGIGPGCEESVAVARSMGASLDASIIGYPGKVSASAAAFANGALVHALNFDPYGPEVGHIGVASFAAPLAMAEAVGGISGKEFLTAVVVGAEVSARITSGITSTGQHPTNNFLAGQLISIFGAATAACRIMNLSKEKVKSAFGLALMQMSGSMQLTRDGDPPAKAIYGAFPNQGGVIAALLSKAGLDANCNALQGQSGLYEMVYAGRFDAFAVGESLGKVFLMDLTHFKQWPTSAVVSPFIEAALKVRQRIVSSVGVTGVTVVGDAKVSPWVEPRQERCRPTNGAAAANSIPFLVAKALVQGSVTLSDFENQEKLHDPSVLALANLIEFVPKSNCIGATVQASVGTELFEDHVAIPRGHPSRPLDRNALLEKFGCCCEYAAIKLGSKAVDRIAEMVLSLEDLKDVRLLTAAISPQSMLLSR
jgi:2-methylcitrate dehydratase PrpD